MSEQEWLAERFDEHRAQLRAVACRLLGSASEADDAVQEAWLRLHRADAADVKNLGGWMTTVVARVCLDMLRARTARREEPLEATRQIASRARRKLEGSAVAETDRRRQGELVQAFLDASRRGDLMALIQLLDPDAVLQPDRVAEGFGAARADGAEAVAQAFSGRAQGAQIALIDRLAGVAWAPGGQLRAVFRFRVDHDKIIAIDLVADREVLRTLDVVLEADER
jgi:DNA-directed RNA polymerase specialized sigma24 family protein